MAEALSISGEQLRSVPGTWGDPLRALARFPGAAPFVGGAGPLAVRGRLPDATPTYVDGVRVSWPFHALLGPTSLSPALIDRVDYYRGEAPARFGFLTGGAIDIHLPERASGTAVFGDVDQRTARAGLASSAGPFGTTVLGSVGAYTTAWLYSRLSSSVEANLYDWQLKVLQRVGRGDLRLLWFGSYDGGALDQPPSFSARPLAQMQRADLRYRCGCGLEVTATYGLDRLAFHGGGAVSAIDLDAAERTLLGRVRWTPSPASTGLPFHVELGAEVERRQADFQLGAQLQSPAVEGQPAQPPISVAFRAPAIGTFASAWAQAAATDGALTVTPGLRVSTAHLAFTAATEAAFEPRLWVDYRASDAYSVHGGAGLYHQPAQSLVP
ncbi:MAG TPA: TonB-dependent receptor, partial [Myxococcales bacterium]|nr:TonB-dependent receptor [Myxococcales bacterium]